MISIPGSLSFAKLVVMLSGPAKFNFIYSTLLSVFFLLHLQFLGAAGSKANLGGPG